ncbi:MAG: T9SS type A sorting domain-containing protein [Chitinophagaceae bacterium]|nr:MAG: T9SS type A sorting domain-containing protein [Chitinophagaceae bacterium]
MRTLFFLVLIHTVFFSRAQERCGVTATDAGNIADAQNIRKAETFLRNKAVARTVAGNDVIRIPVVVHVLYNQPSQNISDAQIQSGLDALNRDFRMRNADTVNTPQRFRHLAADVMIEFYLAKSDPRGRATTGINRKHTSRGGWAPDDKIKLSVQGGLDGWDSKSYLNIWIGNIVGSSGYATVPGSAAATDGIVINTNAFGTINTVAPFNMGRTAVHEVGHWLGLKHIWGDTQCGDDGVDDTPRQGYFTKGCPTGFRSSCSNGEEGDMYMNFMDYTNDACMSLFTLGQGQRMRAAFADGGPRASIISSRGLQEPYLAEAEMPVVKTETALFPNPATDKITVTVGSDLLGKQASIYNQNGQLQQVVILQTTQQSISIAALKPGLYFVKADGLLQKFIKL